MVVDELRPGLYRWTARHPAWVADADAESPGDWPAEVGSVAYAAAGGLILIDPQLPAERPDRGRPAASPDAAQQRHPTG